MLFQDYIQESGTPDDQQVTKFRITLQEYPRRWYSENADSFINIAALERLFKAKFHTVISKAEALRQFQNLALKPNESLSVYKDRVTIAAHKAGIQDEDFLVAQYISGLPSSIRSVVRAHRDATLDEATLTAQAACVDGPPLHATGTVLTAIASPGPEADSFCQFDRNQGRSRQRFRSPSNQRQWRSPARSNSRDRYGDARRSQPRDQTPRGYKSPSRQRVAFKPNSRSPSPAICQFCKSRGHTVGECRKLVRAIKEGVVVCPKDF